MLPHEIVIELRDLLVLQNTIHWIKSITIEDRDGDVRSCGHFKPISSKRFLNDCHEYIFHFTKTGQVEIDRLALGVPYQDKSNISRWSHTRGSDLRCRGNTWFIPYETIQSRAKERPHPATFPVQLAQLCIKLHGVSRVQTMLDPFLGIGNSACFIGEAVCFPRDANGVPYSSVPSFDGGLGENLSSDFTKFPGNGRTRSKIRAASGLAVVYPAANISKRASRLSM